MKSGDLLGTQLEMKAGQFIDKLLPADKNNMTRLTQGLVKSLSEQNMHGAIIGVGGVLTKPAPRKDVDYVVMLNVTRDSSATQYDKATKTMKILEQAAKAIEEESEGFFHISEIAPVRIDRDHEEMGYTLDDGHIQMKPQEGMLIDLIPCRDTNLEEFVKTEKDPFAVLLTF